MSELPTKIALSSILHDKGCDALIWFVCRNALRALPQMGKRKLKNVWPTHTVSNIYAICRVSILLADWLEKPKRITYVKDIVDIVHDAAYIAPFDGAKCAAKAALSAYDISSSVSYKAAYAAESVNIDVDEDAAYCDDDAVFEAYSSILANKIDYINAANADYALLLKQPPSSRLFWHSHPLWVLGEPKQVASWRESFFDELKQLDLGFLAEDLSEIWHGQPMPIHTKNYRNEFSEVVINDPQQLRKAILLDSSTEKIHAVRVLLLGPGGAGKSSLADRLQGKEILMSKSVTQGLDYLQHQPLNLRETFPECIFDNLELYLWDFGGQTIFHGLHRAFLHENCVYVLVVDSRHEQAPDEWLHQIRHLAGSLPKVLLVTNWYEQCESRQNESRLLREFPELLKADNFFYFSCHDAHALDFKRFVSVLAQSSLESQKMVLKETMKVKRVLENYYKEEIFIKEKKLINIIEENLNYNLYADNALEQLEQLGFLIRVKKKESRYCLNPAWIVDNAYNLIYAPKLRHANGVLSLKQIEQLLEGMVDDNYIEYLVGFLEERAICRKLNNDEYFFPDAGSVNEPKNLSKLLSIAEKLTIRFDLPYLPLGFHTRLVHALFGLDKDVGGIINLEHIWREGFILTKRDSQALLQYQTHKYTIEMTLIGNIEYFSDLLSIFYYELKKSVSGNYGIKPEQIYSSAVFNKEVFSIFSCNGLIKELREIKNFNQLFDKVGKMSQKIFVNVGNNSQVAIDNKNVTQKYQGSNTVTTITSDQRQIINSVLDELLGNNSNFSSELLEAIQKTQRIVRTDSENPTVESRSLLSNIWVKLKDITKFGSDMVNIGEFVTEHQTEITNAILESVQLIS